MMAQLERVLQQLGTESIRPPRVEDIQCVSREDLQQIWSWNASVPEPEEKCVHDLISIQARHNPHATAVSAWDGELKYGELDLISSRLAMHLTQLGIGPNCLVPLCFEKSMWTPVAMVAVMKTEAGFILMDADQPEARLQEIVKQAGATLIVSSAANVDVVDRLTFQSVVLDWPNVEKFNSRSLVKQQTSPSSTLYVAFTSGSTGTPKGVVTTHTNFASAVHQPAALNINATARVFDFASYNFDVAINNILMTLAMGGCVCVPSNAERQNNLEGAINRTQASVMELTPSVARLINPTAVPSITLLNLGGEQPSSSDIIPWLPYVEVINTYGPAECTVTTVANTRISKMKDAGARA